MIFLQFLVVGLIIKQIMEHLNYIEMDATSSQIQEYVLIIQLVEIIVYAIGSVVLISTILYR